MGGIGGFWDRERRIPADRLVRMSRFALEEGEHERTGYWNAGVGLFQNGGVPAFDSFEERDFVLVSDAEVAKRLIIQRSIPTIILGASLWMSIEQLVLKMDIS